MNELFLSILVVRVLPRPLSFILVKSHHLLMFEVAIRIGSIKLD